MAVISSFDLNAHVLAFSTALGQATTVEEMRRIFETYPLDASPIAGSVVDEVQEPRGIWIGHGSHPKNDRGLYLHGGGYVTGSPTMYSGLVSRLARVTRSWIFVPEFPLAPEHPFPAAHEAAVTAARYAMHSGPLASGAASRIFLAGDSCGAALAFATAMRLRDEEGADCLSALLGLSPLLDMTATAESYDRCAASDKMISRDVTRQCAGLYAPNIDAADPLLSPIQGRFARLPPMLLQVSEHEAVFDDSTRASRVAQRDGCQLEVQTWPGMPHVWHLLAPHIPEADNAIARIGEFIARVRVPETG
jgi:monoterpene epsilon-lactone hydrolase